MCISDLMLQSEILNVHYLYPQFRALLRDLNRLLQNLLEFCNVLCNCKLKLLIAKVFARQTLNATFFQIPL